MNRFANVSGFGIYFSIISYIYIYIYTGLSQKFCNILLGINLRCVYHVTKAVQAFERYLLLFVVSW